MGSSILPAGRGREKLLTIADLARMPRSLPSGDVCYELKDGNLIVMAPPGDSHSRRQLKISQILANHGEDRGLGEARCEVGIVLRRNPDRVVGADAAFVLKDSLPVRTSPEGYLETIPELVVEVRSKNDTPKEITEKNEEYFDAGVQSIWLIDPAFRSITALRRGWPEQTFSETDTLTCHLLPGFAVPVAHVFAGS